MGWRICFVGGPNGVTCSPLKCHLISPETIVFEFAGIFESRPCDSILCLITGPDQPGLKPSSEKNHHIEHPI